MHLPNILLPGPARLRLTTLTATTERIILDLTATQTSAHCPTCASEATHIHSYYQRTVADLPWASLPVQLHLHVRRFLCGNVACARVTFSETARTDQEGDRADRDDRKRSQSDAGQYQRECQRQLHLDQALSAAAAYKCCLCHQLRVLLPEGHPEISTV